MVVHFTSHPRLPNLHYKANKSNERLYFGFPIVTFGVTHTVKHSWEEMSPHRCFMSNCCLKAQRRERASERLSKWTKYGMGPRARKPPPKANSKEKETDLLARLHSLVSGLSCRTMHGLVWLDLRMHDVNVHVHTLGSRQTMWFA